ncbi:hypothetical protein A1F94_003785 [Pyrenophora tritici-repentis]|uniref:Uncharacterized protein n=1 Tax=Pyrenophora tritici-repentis TaxID=45151 RepID=A0A2W1DN36_9PLEO|nr:hypothetical protein PtrV1_05007 [Pyrenophora tritici-repentis]KAF7452680.1 hypothetical protein A1F99_044580 [Pyrenophora tritici-repentis]KAF7574142.1 hypothetical protein PtrM4_057650 [Pyrenophora tritici-repentis]KAG9387035.1 hypothetical protein A1F94_003785 [Pyrenophora tritici-repentis]KAI0570302.1 hypothetical protein Alg215_11136 [Pyrenophora tritici-repentis]
MDNYTLIEKDSSMCVVPSPTDSLLAGSPAPDSQAPPLPHLPPPPPPPGGVPTWVAAYGAIPPPPPPPDSFHEDLAQIVHIVPFSRNVYVTQYAAHATDYKEYEWLLKYGSTELWYEKPSKTYLRNIETREVSQWLDELPSLPNARPVSLERPRVWASAAMRTPIDDDVPECLANHPDNTYPSRSCFPCSNKRATALGATSLVYCLILSTYQAADPFVHGSHFHGKPIYKLIKCGSRDAAVSEAYYSAGVNGWNLAFSCVMRLGEDYEKRDGEAKKVLHLWSLSEEDEDRKNIRTFY